MLRSSRSLSRLVLRRPASAAICRIPEISTSAHLIRPITTSKASHTEPTSITQDTQDDIPWYLREEESSKLDAPIFKAEMPELPHDSPELLKPTLEYMINELGLDEFKIFDIRNREDLPISTVSDIMVICQGKSERHVQNASQELVSFLKREYNTFPYIEGLVKPNSMIRMRRRLKRRMINKRTSTVDSEFGAGPNSWVMIDTQLGGIFLHILTPERRNAVNLEYLWCNPEDKELYAPTSNTSSRSYLSHDEDSVFANIFRRSYSTQRQIDLDKLASQQLQVGDFDGFVEIAPKIREDQQIATTVMKNIIDDFKKSSIDDILNSDEISHIKFLNQSFPSLPTKENWDQRFEFYSLLHLASPDDVFVRSLTSSLLLQASAGEPVTKSQLLSFLNVLNRSSFLNQGQTVTNMKDLNVSTHLKYKQLFKVLALFDVNNNEVIDDEVLLEILRLPTQQHLYNSGEIVPLASSFKNILEVFQNREHSDKIVEFVLTAYLKSDSVEPFFEYWRRLKTYKAEGSNIIIDNRPWGLFFNLIKSDYREIIVEVFIHEELPALLESKIELTSEHKEQILSILNKFDDSGKSYKSIRQALA